MSVLANIFWIILASLVLVSCGGGGSGGAPVPTALVAPTNSGGSGGAPVPTDPSPPTSSGGPTNPVPADCPVPGSSEGTLYQLTFSANWTSVTHPTQFPVRGPHFSGLVGGVHSSDHHFWRSTQRASPGIESMAEDGQTPTLKGEIDAADKAVAYTRGGPGNIGSVTLTFRVNQACPLATFTSMLAPSHDWFVGVDSLDLRDANGNFENKMVDLRVYDAGTEDGEDFSFSGNPTSPQGIIKPLTTSPANTDFKDGVHRTTGAHVGRFQFTVMRSSTMGLAQSAEAALILETTRAIADQGMNAVITRIQDSKAGLSQFRFRILPVEQVNSSGSLGWKDLLGSFSFGLPSDGENPNPGLVVWGRSNYQQLAGKRNGLQWDGELFSTYLGVDKTLSNNLLAGLMLSWNQGNFGYRLSDLRGGHDIDLVTLHPYLNWNLLNGRFDLWTTASYGQGDLALKRTDHSSYSDINMRTFAVGVSGLIFQTHSSGLKIKGELLQTNTRVDEDALSSVSAMKGGHISMALVGKRVHRLQSGGRLAATLELAIKQEQQGQLADHPMVGIEVAGEFSATQGALTLTGQSRLFLTDGSKLDRWSMGGSIALDPGALNRGLRFTLSPKWGDASAPGLSQNWPGQPDQTLRKGMSMQLGYGMPLNQKWHLAPYLTTSFISDGKPSYLLGTQLRVSERLTLQLEAREQGAVEGLKPDRSLRLNIRLTP